jgi:hypothetical protein
MEKRVMKSNSRSRETDEASERNRNGSSEPVLGLMGLVIQITGTLLGSLAVSAQIGNLLVCICLMFFGPAFIIKLLV